MGFCKHSENCVSARLFDAIRNKLTLHKRTVVVALILLFVIAACGDSAAGEPTPRPTYTPYPTYTPVPTATLRPTYTPYPETNSVQKDTETIEVGNEEWFFGKTLAAVEKGRELYELGQYEAAISAFEEAKQRRGKPSDVIESWLGLSYDGLGRYDLAIQHHGNAIAINDDAINRVNRSISYFENDQCDLATVDAKAALTKAPEATEGYHTDVEANWVLAVCYYDHGEYLLALQHADASLSGAGEHGYPDMEIKDMNELRDVIKFEMSR